MQILATYMDLCTLRIMTGVHRAVKPARCAPEYDEDLHAYLVFYGKESGIQQ